MDKNKYYCRINGTIYNLSKVQDILDKKLSEDIAVTLCTEYGIDAIEALTFEDVIKFNDNQIPADYNEALKRFQEYNMSQLPKCPFCGSTNISQRRRFMARGGYYKSYDEYTCHNCKHEWK